MSTLSWRPEIFSTTLWRPDEVLWPEFLLLEHPRSRENLSERFPATRSTMGSPWPRWDLEPPSSGTPNRSSWRRPNTSKTKFVAEVWQKHFPWPSVKVGQVCWTCRWLVTMKIWRWILTEIRIRATKVECRWFFEVVGLIRLRAMSFWPTRSSPTPPSQS